LPLKQSEVPLNGHAVEARLYAEDPERGFLPSTGTLVALKFPEKAGVRVDTGVEEGAEVTPYYDPMIAKLIAHAPSREEALNTLAAALDQTVVAGPRTNVAFLASLCRSGEFRNGRFDTGNIERNHDSLEASPRVPDNPAAAQGASRLFAREQRRIEQSGSPDSANSPWALRDAFQLSGERITALPVLVDGRPAVAQLRHGGDAAVTVEGVAADPESRVIERPEAVYVLRRGRQTIVRPADNENAEFTHANTGGLVLAPMHGRILSLAVEEGAEVHKGQRVAVIEAMKMEHALVSPIDGTVSEIAVPTGEQVAEGAKIMIITPAGGNKIS
jgi:3-methylcrotonyl-CoA carboxylase alpha subunit